MRKLPVKVKKPAAINKLHASFGGEDFPVDDGKDKAAQSLGRRGGQARTKALSAKKRKELAQAAARARWKR